MVVAVLSLPTGVEDFTVFVIHRYSIENAYLEEKEDACNSIRDIAVNVGKDFYPYLDDCYQQINLLTEVSLLWVGLLTAVAIDNRILQRLESEKQRCVVWDNSRYCGVPAWGAVMMIVKVLVKFTMFHYRCAHVHARTHARTHAHMDTHACAHTLNVHFRC